MCNFMQGFDLSIITEQIFSLTFQHLVALCLTLLL